MHRTLRHQMLLVATIALTAIASIASAGTADRLLVCGWSSGNVVGYDAGTGAGLGVLVPSGSGGLGLAHSVRLGPDGSLYVTSVASNRVLRYDAETGDFIDVFVSPTGTSLSAPTDAVFGPDGNLYVASFNNGRVLRFDGRTGEFIDTFSIGAGAGRVEMLAWGLDGDLYATTGNGNSVAVFNGATGASMGNFVSPGLGGLVDPHGLAFGPDGDLYVTSFGTPLVLRFDGATGSLLDDFAIEDNPGTPENETGGLASPHGIAFDDGGSVYVCSFGTNQVLRYDAAGSFLGVFASGGGLTQPTHLVFTEPARPRGDVNGDGVVDVDDLVRILIFWGVCPGCDADLDGNGMVDVDDLVLVILNWS